MCGQLVTEAGKTNLRKGTVIVMTDIHCHILPDIDDGASDMGESIKMARMAYDSGVTELAATPHFFGEEESLGLLTQIKEGLDSFRRALSAEGIPLTVYSGAEILCTEETPVLAQMRCLPTIGDGRYALCEFYFDESVRTMEYVLGAIKREGYIPVVAHPERYEDIQRDPRIIGNWFEHGIIIQVNRGSLLGRFGQASEEAADYILSHGLAHAIASDAHSSRMRTPYLADIKRYAVESFGADYAKILLSENPARILRGKRVVSPYEL